MTVRPTNKLLASFAGIILLFFAAALSFAASPPSESKTVRMGFFESKGMFEGCHDEDKKSGYCYEYMMQISNYTGWNYEFVYGSFASLYEMLKKGEIDILPYTNFNEQRGKEVLFSDVILAEEEYYLAVNPKTRDVSNGIKSLNGAVISTMKNADYNSLLFDFIKKNNLDVDVNYYHYVDEIWDALRGDNADATIFTSISYSDDDWRCVCSFGKKPTYICVAKNRPDLLAELNEATDLIDKESPAFRESHFASYFSDNPVRKNLTLEEEAWVKEHPVLRVGGFPNDAPYYYSVDEETNMITGLTVDVVNGIIERLELDMTAEFKSYNSVAEMEAALDAGEIDVIMPFYPNYYIAQQHNLIVSNTVRMSSMELVFKKGTPYSEAIAKIATPATKLGIFYVQDNFPESEIVGANSIQEAVNFVLDGKANGAVAQNVVLHYIREKYDNLSSIILSEGCGTCFATLPENYELIRILNRGLMFFPSVEIAAISSKYALETDVTIRAFLASHKEVLIMLICVLVLIVALIFLLFKMNSLKVKADDANRLKTVFLNNMSHDIRTPLNAVTGFNNMALMELGKDDEKVRDYLEKIGQSSDALLTIINDILEISRIEAGKITLSEDKGNVLYSFVNIESMLKEIARKAKIELQFDFGKVDDLYVICDFAHCGRIFTNLIGNAIKYTRAGGHVKVHCEQTGRRDDGYGVYTYTITDDGIGMSEEFMKNIFQPFSREDSLTVRKIQGSGLGLALCKDMVEIMGGKISCTSRLGQGSTFTVVLPFKIQEGQEYVIPQKISTDTDKFLEGKKLLLVDDNELNREIMSTILKEMGAEVTEANDGAVAVDIMSAAAADDFDFILMDIQMPIINGFEATREIRAMGTEASRIPIIAVTANAYDEDRKAAIEVGMNGHIAKPIDINKLKEELAHFL